MTPLTAKESIAMTMLDLASAYEFQHGNDSFVLKVANAALAYFPKCIPLLMTKANYYRTIGLAEKKKHKHTVNFCRTFTVLIYRNDYKILNDLEVYNLPYYSHNFIDTFLHNYVDIISQGFSVL